MAVWALVRDHADVIEGDLQVHANTDLRDLYEGRLSLRRVGVLIAAMPEHTRTHDIASNKPEHLRGWTTDRILLGRILDSTELLLRLTYNVNSDTPLKDDFKSVVPQAVKKATEEVVVMRPSQVGSALGI